VQESKQSLYVSEAEQSFDSKQYSQLSADNHLQNIQIATLNNQLAVQKKQVDQFQEQIHEQREQISQLLFENHDIKGQFKKRVNDMMQQQYSALGQHSSQNQTSHEPVTSFDASLSSINQQHQMQSAPKRKSKSRTRYPQEKHLLTQKLPREKLAVDDMSQMPTFTDHSYAEMIQQNWPHTNTTKGILNKGVLTNMMSPTSVASKYISSVKDHSGQHSPNDGPQRQSYAPNKHKKGQVEQWNLRVDAKDTKSKERRESKFQKNMF
jgi:hypothetical protein